MRTARLCIVPGGGGREVLWSGPGGGVVAWSWGGGGRCCDLIPGGWRCCGLVPGGEMLWLGPGGREGGVVTWSGGREVLWSGPGGREVLWPGPWSPTSPPPRVGQTNACENITFARFATWAVKTTIIPFITSMHSSMMRIAHRLIVSRGSAFWDGLPSGEWGMPSGWVCLLMGASACPMASWEGRFAVNRQTRVKTLPSHNFVCRR